MTRASAPFLVSLPAAPLRKYVSHYWLSLDNTDETCSILPDGAVDIVAAVGQVGYRVDIFGTTTSRAELSLDGGCHYLGIRFRPGQGRHFMDACARDLTNGSRPGDGLLYPDLRCAVESVVTDRVFSCLDAALLKHMKRRSPRPSRIDEAIRHIESTRGGTSISRVVDAYGKSRRQFERHFLDVVGVPAKLFAEIVRFQQASALLARTSLPLARIAAELGYADQSHMTHAFSRFLGDPPARARKDVAFLQEAGRLPGDNEGSRFTC